MKTLKNWAEELPPRIRKAFLENAEKQGRLELMNRTLSHCIYDTIWGDTPEGYNFWEKVHNCIVNNQPLTDLENSLPNVPLENEPLEQERIDKAISELKEFERDEREIDYNENYFGLQVKYLPFKDELVRFGNAKTIILDSNGTSASVLIKVEPFEYVLREEVSIGTHAGQIRIGYDGI
jgi:hypothetical protein